MREDIEIANFGEEAAFCSVEIQLGADFADLFEVKEGRVEKHGELDGAARERTRHVLVHARRVPARDATSTSARCRASPANTSRTRSSSRRAARGHVHAGHAGARRRRRSRPATCAASRSSVRRRSARLEEWTRRLPVVTSDDDQFRALLERSTRDLAALRIFDPEYPDRAVVAAGAPWFMTLFGRDSLLTSWMTMLVDPDLALGTLADAGPVPGHATSTRSPRRSRAASCTRCASASPSSLALGGGRVYYGTVDATPLFVMLLGELSRWGSRRDEVDALLPAADRALAWITDYGDKDGDGYVEYQRTSDRGLQNQGWKDSWDSMRFIDGSLATPPIALCEVQGYVYAALVARSHMRDRGRRPRARGVVARRAPTS